MHRKGNVAQAICMPAPHLPNIRSPRRFAVRWPRRISILLLSVTIRRLDLFKIEAGMGKCARNAFTIFLRYASGSGGFVPRAFNAVLHRVNDSLGVAIWQ